jgi:RNA polymerase sigma-70 factor, ECF subfamily
MPAELAGPVVEPESGGLRASPAVVTGASAGREELGALYETWFDFVWRSARRLGVDASAADDVVQEVFLVVQRQLGGFEGRSSMKTWLFGILRHVVHRHRRKARASTEALDEARVPGTGSPERDAETNEAVVELDAMLATLDDDKREVFVLAHLEQMTAPEIAEALEVKLNTVYSRLRLAQEAMERALDRRRARDRWRPR